MFNPFRNKGSQESDKKGAASAALPVRSASQVLSELMNGSLPDAIDSLLFRVSMADPQDFQAASGFERYAARLLNEAGAPALRSIAVEHPLDLRHLNMTKLFWVSFDASQMTDEQRDVVLSVESALNRLSLVVLDAEGADAQASLDEAACSLRDWAAIRSITSGAERHLTACERDNKLLTLNDVSGVRGGNWDVSTRFAAACESMALPYRLEYRFDCDAPNGTIVVHVTQPRPEQLPRSQWVPAAGAWQDCSAQQPAAAAAYALRLAALVAAAAFGSSVGITRVIVNGHEGSLDAPVVLSLEFSRVAFMAAVAPALRDGSFEAEYAQCDPATMFSLVKPTRWALSPDEAGRSLPVEALESGLPDRHVPLAEDSRPLPADLATLLHADVASDLDVMSEQDPALKARFEAAMADREDAPLLAIAQLEDIVASTAPAPSTPDEAAATPLYCEGVFARYLVDLVSDSPDERYCRASDTAQSARGALSRLYLDMGDLEGALAQAKACVELAPTSPSPYQDVITAYAEMGRYDLVVDVAKHALRCCLLDDSSSYTYYRLAFAYWQTDRREEALACYTRVKPSSGMKDAAEREMADLMSEMGRGPMDYSESAGVLRTAGVTIAPNEEAVKIVTRAAIGLCDAGLPLAAAPAVGMLAHLERHDVLSAVGVSLRKRG